DATLRVVVTATDLSGSSSAASAQTAPVQPAPPPPPMAPVNTAPPAIAGAAHDGGTLTASAGTWTGTPVLFSYQWRRCDSAGGGCADVSGAREPTYMLTPADVGATMRVAETAYGADGPAVSDPSPVVTASAPSVVSEPTVTG